MLAGCPIVWASRLQTEIALSTTEAEYISLSVAMRELIPFVNLIQELAHWMGFPEMKPDIKCTVFEDNNRAIELARAPKMRPRTKRIGLKYYFFRNMVS